MKEEWAVHRAHLTEESEAASDSRIQDCFAISVGVFMLGQGGD